MSYQKSILRTLRLPMPRRSIARLSPPCGMFCRMSIFSGWPLSYVTTMRCMLSGASVTLNLILRKLSNGPFTTMESWSAA